MDTATKHGTAASIMLASASIMLASIMLA